MIMIARKTDQVDFSLNENIDIFFSTVDSFQI